MSHETVDKAAQERVTGEDLSRLASMPARYHEVSDSEDIVRHEKLLSQTMGGAARAHAAVTYHGDIEEFWLGPCDFHRLRKLASDLDSSFTSPLFRVWVERDERFMICASYPRVAGSAREEEPSVRPPVGWREVEDELAAERGHTRVRTILSTNEEGARLEVWAAGVAPGTFLRNVLDVVESHGVSLAWFEWWQHRCGSKRPAQELHIATVQLRGEVQQSRLVSMKEDLERYLQTRLRAHSLFDIIGPSMVGPSSSHTAGANRLGQLSRILLRSLEEVGGIAPVESLEVRLFGSFRDTGAGHGTHIALGAGLKGLQTDDARLKKEGAPAVLASDGVRWGKRCVRFAGFFPAPEDEDARFIEPNGGCANIAEVVAKTASEEVSVVGFSLGGGLVELRFLNGARLQPAVTGKEKLYIGPEVRLGGDSLDLGRAPVPGAVSLRRIYVGRPPIENPQIPYNTFEEALEGISDGSTLVELALATESALQGSPANEVEREMQRVWGVMNAAIDSGLANDARTPMGLSGAESSKVVASLEGAKAAGIAEWASAYAMASAETNAMMGVVVACPTGGACGVLPGVVRACVERGGQPNEAVPAALLVAALIGMIVYDDVPTAGAMLGCQAEIGVGAAMAAAAMAHLHGADPETTVHAAILALKNSMGLVCDPVAGLVEVPCVKRNALFAASAVAAARLALAGVRSQISPDEVVLAVREVGERLHPDYKESARGGLATTRDGKEVGRRFAALCADVFR